MNGHFTLRIDTDNAAFDNPEELARIIHKTAEQVADTLQPWHTRSVFDVNGNRVGGWAIKEEDA